MAYIVAKIYSWISVGIIVIGYCLGITCWIICFSWHLLRFVMGCSQSSVDVIPSKRKSSKQGTNDEIDMEPVQPEIQVLLLGAGESGKSTIIKQIRLIHGGGFAKEEFVLMKTVIQSNVIQSMMTILTGMESLGIPFENEDSVMDKTWLTWTALSLRKNPNHVIGNEAKMVLLRLWNDSGVQDSLSRSREYRLNDSAEYFLKNIQRICDDNYSPTEKDILRSRVQTRGVEEQLCEFLGRKFRFIDIGSHQDHIATAKWIQCISLVKIVIFMVALTDYDVRLQEDDEISKLTHDRQIFKSIVESQWFADKEIILFFNKCDLFERRIKRFPLNRTFQEYEGGNNLKESSSFIMEKFDTSVQKVYKHRTCAVNRRVMENIFKDMCSSLIEQNVKGCKLF